MSMDVDSLLAYNRQVKMNPSAPASSFNPETGRPESRDTASLRSSTVAVSRSSEIDPLCWPTTRTDIPLGCAASLRRYLMIFSELWKPVLVRSKCVSLVHVYIATDYGYRRSPEMKVRPRCI